MGGDGRWWEVVEVVEVVEGDGEVVGGGGRRWEGGR